MLRSSQKFLSPIDIKYRLGQPYDFFNYTGSYADLRKLNIKHYLTASAAGKNAFAFFSPVEHHDHSSRNQTNKHSDDTYAVTQKTPV